ncbi:hypothetical protein [Rhizorhabdus sp. FW153]|uniref:hypothetical protein n=1 Tax=Rhizorhabdus sp. FW153 TaxID=3400216 RepID=UPI003CE7DCCA
MKSSPESTLYFSPASCPFRVRATGSVRLDGAQPVAAAPPLKAQLALSLHLGMSPALLFDLRWIFVYRLRK